MWPFRFQIGELVVHRAQYAAVKLKPFEACSVGVWCVVARISEECSGGIQLKYQLSGTIGHSDITQGLMGETELMPLSECDFSQK